MVDVTASLAKFISGLSLEHVPASIQHEARRFALDTLGCIIAGAQSELGPVIRSAAELFGEGSDASVAGAGKRFTALAASYGNGRLANCLDLDETYPGGQVAGLHFGGSVLAEALAVCEQKELTSKELLLALVCGYEVAGRISDIGTQMTIEAGRVSSMPEIYGFALEATLGASAAAGRLLGQDAAALEQTFGMAASSAAIPIGPVWAKQIATPNTKYFDSGWAAMTGGFAARSVELGSTALPSIFDGSPSIFTVVGSRRVDPDGLIGELGSRWALANITYKPWPNCRMLHHSLSALRKLRAEEKFELDEIEEIVVGTHVSRLSRRWLTVNPTDVVSRQFSIPHAISLFLLDVTPGPAWESEHWASDPAATALRAKVRYVDYARAMMPAQYFVRGQYRQLPCFVRIGLRSRTLRAEADFAWGDPWSEETRFSDDDIVAKFRTVSNLPTIVADRVIETVMSAKAGASLSPIFEAMTPRALGN
ncbi:MmgE/PrpD family protein [Bradyrhizobium sp. Gha]|uniref:MmgE/PrpD family protein n=1 Tax=Bradyrhizobium sp. Gha TaxID=1855318 RepID=UPI0008F192C5|nr:MmgE/PrpD family protein [Bradyrhizobium sp. Gha]SFK14584.1 2-methylcitrate dehydratase PrpD [Bradyrhizobium sp. Gha]